MQPLKLIAGLCPVYWGNHKAEMRHTFGDIADNKEGLKISILLIHFDTFTGA